MMRFWPLQVLLLTWCLGGGTAKAPAGLEMVSKGITEYFRSGVKPYYLDNALKQQKMPRILRSNVNVLDNNPTVCFLCNLVVDLVFAERQEGADRDALAGEVEYLCTTLGIESQRVCSGVIELNLDVFLYIVDNHPNLTSSRVCGSVLQNYGCQKDGEFEWAIDISEGESSPRPPSPNISHSFNILQLSDIHYDPNYLPNGNADCGEPICCQSDQGEPASQETACGYWTDYRDADVPWHLVEEAARQVQSHEFDYVYYTGDIISHRVWDTSITNNTQTIAQLYSFFKDTFNVPVFPVFGNHEPHPLNLWPTESVGDGTFSAQWLFELAAKAWSELIGEDVSETVLKGGYYSVSPRPGFRIIAVNSNLCYTLNWWLIFEDVDPYGQLQWLADTLKLAEENNESVHILSHIPTGTTDSLSVWGREYSRIIERFSNTITGQFNGHTHRDEFQVYYSEGENRPVGVVFNGASLTPYDLSNPSYKIYQVDSSSFILQDYEEWTFNLTLANLQPVTQSPHWYKLYSFREAYGVDSLEPLNVDSVLYKMASNHSLLDDYFKFYFRNGDPGISSGCDEACKRSYLCQIATTVYGDDAQCKRFSALFDK